MLHFERNPDGHSHLSGQGHASGRLASEGLQESLLRQISAHQLQDRQQSVLSQVVSFVSGQASKARQSLNSLKQAQEKLQAGNHAKSSGSKLGADIEAKIKADAAALNSRNYYTDLGTGFIKSAALFTRGKFGLLATGISYGLDKLNTNKSHGQMLRDSALAACEGMSLKGIFALSDRFSFSPATKGIVIGAGSRLAGACLAPEHLFHGSTGKLTAGNAIYHGTNELFDRTALAFDVASFGTAHCILGRAGASELLRNNKLLSHAMSGFTFGISNGFSGSISGQMKQLERQGSTHSSGGGIVGYCQDTVNLWKQLDFRAAGAAAIERGALDAAAAMAGHGVSNGAGRASDYVNVKTGQGIKFARYAERYLASDLRQSPQLMSLAKHILLTGTGRHLRVQPGAESTRADHEQGRIYIAKRAGVEKLGHELMESLTASEFEARFKAVDRLVEAGKGNEARQLYLQLRLEREQMAREAELTITSELRHGTGSSGADVIAGEPAYHDSSNIGNELTPAGITYREHWGREFDAARLSGKAAHPTVDFSSYVHTRLVQCLKDGRIDDAKNIIEHSLEHKLLTPEEIPTTEIRDAAKSGLTECLSNGWIGDAKEIIDFILEHKLLTPEQLATPEIRDAAKSVLPECLSNGGIGDAKEIIDFSLEHKLLTPNQISSAANSGLTKCLAKGWIDKAKEIIDFSLERNLLTPEEIPTTEIRDAAKSRLRKCLAKGWIDAAKEIIDFILEHKLLTPEQLATPEISSAAQSVLPECLSNGGIGDAKEIIDFILEHKLLTPEEIPTTEIRDAAKSRLRKCLAKGWINKAKEIIDFSLERKLLDQNAVDTCMRLSVQAGHITGVVRAALVHRMDLNTALKLYLDIAELTNDTAAALFEQLKMQDKAWEDQDNVIRPFEEGAAIFGAAQMLRYVFKANATPHDALSAFHNIIRMYQRSGLKPECFSNILCQVNKDDAIDDTGSSFSRLNAIAQSFPDDINTVIEQAKQYPDSQLLQELLPSFPNAQSVFASWPSLQRFAKLQYIVGQTELLPKLQQLKQENQGKLADWIEALAFHRDSKVSLQSLLDFWKDPAKFLDINEIHSPESHERKKPSNYTDIPHLDLTAVQLRDALVDGTLDRLQVFSPMKVEYEIGGSDVNLAAALDQALGSRQEKREGTAKSVGKLFNAVNKILKHTGIKLKQVLSGDKLPDDLQKKLEGVLYNSDFGVNRPEPGLRLIAEIHKKSDPLAVVAGNDTASCMGFGTGKNNVYMFNPNDALFTVRLVRSDGKSRTIAQSVLTKDRDVKVPFPAILQKLQDNENTALHTIFPEAALRNEKAVIAADNIEVHPNYIDGKYPAALEAVYRDFFARYITSHGESENLRADQLIIGLGHSDAMLHLPKTRNTFVPQAPVGYTDKSHDHVLSLSLTRPQKIPVRVLSVENSPVPQRIAPQASVATGITPLTFEDTLPLAYLEGKAFQDNPTLQVGLHNMENALIAMGINDAAKKRPNLSLKYVDQDGRMKAYLFAYQGKYKMADDGVEQSVIYIGDFSSDRPTGDRGTPIPTPAAGKLLLEFGKLYKKHYLDQEQLMPIFINARDKTSYELLQKQIKSLGKRVGCQFKVQEIATHQSGNSTMHDRLIVPHLLP